MKRFKKIRVLVLAVALCTVSLFSQAATAKSPYTDKKTQLAYTLINVPHGNVAIQNLFVTENYVYTTQRIAASGDRKRDDVAFARFAINQKQKTATYKDEMILLDCGHGEILDRYCYKNVYYFLVGTKSVQEKKDNKNIWAVQAGRLKYEPGVKKKYTQICRLAGLANANKSGKSDMEAVRVAAAASGDDTQLAVRVELELDKKRYLQYSTYDLKKVNALLDKAEAKSSKYVSCGGNASLMAACQYSFCQAKSQAVRPNDSFQGMEISGSGIYLAGGTGGSTCPKIARINRANGKFVSGVNLTDCPLSHIALKGKEIEGLCIRGSNMYFVIKNNAVSSVHCISKF